MYCWAVPHKILINYRERMKGNFIDSWHLFHSESLWIIFHSLWQMLHSLFHFSLWRLKISFHSPTVGVSLNISFPLTPHFNFNFISLWQLLHPLSHSAMAAVSWNISFFLAFILIKFSFHHGSYFILPQILSHPPLAAISCNISFLLAFLSIIFSFLQGSYFILPCFQGPSNGSSGVWSHDLLLKMGWKWKWQSCTATSEICFNHAVKCSHCWDIGQKNFQITSFFLFFFEFFSLKTTANTTISTNLEGKKKGLQLLYHGKFGQKRKIHTLKGPLILTD